MPNQQSPADKRVQILIDRQWFEPTLNRECGTCAECCTWLGIEELRKWTGQACKHLDGRDPVARCTIYPSRPSACAGYSCFWKTGFGPEALQPNRSGLLITPYRREDRTGTDIGSTAVTVIITDESKAGSIMETTISELMILGVTEIRLVNFKRKTGLLYKDGEIFRCRILQAQGYEALTFSTDGIAIATYKIQDQAEPDHDQATK